MVGAAIAVAGTVASTVGSLSASSSQAGAIADGSAAAIAAQQEMYQQARTDSEPWRTAGSTALTATNNLLGLNGADAAAGSMAAFQTSPGYGFQVSEGMKAIDHAAAARGLLRSGATMKAEQTLGSNLANQEFTNYYNRLAGISSAGLSAVNALTAAGTQTGAGIAGTDASASKATSDIYGNQGKTIGNAASSLTNIAGQAYASSQYAGGTYGNSTIGTA